MELFEYKKSVAFIKYLSDNVINIIDKKKHAEVRSQLKSLFDINYFNLLSKTKDSVNIMVKSKSSVKVYNVRIEDGLVTTKGERNIVNAKKDCGAI